MFCMHLNVLTEPTLTLTLTLTLAVPLTVPLTLPCANPRYLTHYVDALTDAAVTLDRQQHNSTSIEPIAHWAQLQLGRYQWLHGQVRPNRPGSPFLRMTSSI